ncbi:MAG: MDR family MFS transporter [Chloroflexota bacterium]
MTQRQKFILLNALMLCMFVAALDQAIMSVAMPRILSDLGGFQLQSWALTSYLLASTVVVSVIGKLSDMFGRKHFMLAGIVVFVTGSIGCGLAPSMIALILARTVQGAGGGVIFACVFATLGDLFTPIERVRYVGYFTSTFTISSLVGPTLGGFLADGLGWRWCFYVNIPIGIVAMALIWTLMPSSRRGGRLADIDFLGAGLLAVATTAFILSIDWGQKTFGLFSAETMGMLAVAFLFGGVFIWQERRHPEAILPLFLFKNRQFVQPTLIVMAVGGGIFSSVQFLPTFLQTSIGTSATASGLVVLPQSIGVLISGSVGGQIVGRTGRYKRQVTVGATMALIATSAMLTLNEHSSPYFIAVLMGSMGLGLGLVMPLMSTLIQNAVSHELMGVASSSRQFFMSIASVFGVAILALVFTSGYVSAFNADPALSRELPPAVREKFEDPTLYLNHTGFPIARNEVLALPGGESLLDRTLTAQRAAMSVAAHHLFIGTTTIAALMFLFAVTLHEVPLRRNFGGAGQPQAAMPTVDH